MLRLEKLTKDYYLGKGIDTVHALKGISIAFRKNEFVSILGPSGCGKTTLLNIIGGLDKYTNGEMFINHISTKKYKSRDWDVYRNHSIGFIFQSYNLIPHQTILENVILALTISGVSKKEKVNRAKEALEKVGLGKMMKKRPSQLSGGQCQRVSIARALVNNPDILLADEPTGALDSKTSVQILDLIKEISKEKLVIMVTHNADLAEQYSNRIVKLKDGEIIDDSNPYSIEDELNEIIESNTIPSKSNRLKAKMNLASTFKLSLRNLISKGARTFMTSLAGSIGIIGVSLVLAISSGITNYIDSIQDDMLSGNPITITEQTIDFNSLMNMTSYAQKEEAIIEKGIVNINSILESLVKSSTSLESLRVSNTITQEYIDYLYDMDKSLLAAIDCSYGIDINNYFYTGFKESNTSEETIMSISAITENYRKVLSKTDYSKYSTFITQLSTLFEKAIDNEEYIRSQYDVEGEVAKEKDEIMIVLNSRSELSDLLMAQLGYYTQDELLNIAYRAAEDEKYDSTLDRKKVSYEELINKEFYYYPNDSVFTRNVDNDDNPFTYNAYQDDVNNKQNGFKLKVTGVLIPKENIQYGCLENGFMYTEALSQYILEQEKDSEIVKYLNDNSKTSISSYLQKFGGSEKIIGVSYTLKYRFENEDFSEVCFPGTSSIMASFGSTLSLSSLGSATLPSEISIYPLNFETKDEVLEYLDAWNSDKTIIVNGKEIDGDSRDDITYTDTLSIIINMLKTMINVITYALISFTALSLVVSSVMIGIITYVSVVERIKEIGIIRALGGRKLDVSNLFRAETFIIGFTSGIIGISITYFLSFIVNIIVKLLTGVYPIASLSAVQAIIMVIISVTLTLISGQIPAKSAARKDPVVALRTE